jgi:predicted ester cyclase
MSAKDKKALVLRLYEKFDKGEWDDIAEAIDSNFTANVLGTTTLDWEGFKQFGNAFLSAFPDGRHVFEYVVADGENVVTIGTYQGSHKGEMQGISPTNTKLKLPVMHLDRVVNGKIVKHYGLANEVDLMRQLGVVLVPK